MYNLFSPYLEFRFEEKSLSLKLKQEIKILNLSNYDCMIKEIIFSEEEKVIITKQLQPYKISYEDGFKYGMAAYLGYLFVLEYLICFNIPYYEDSPNLLSSNMFDYIYSSLNILTKVGNVQIKKLSLFVQIFINIWKPFILEGPEIPTRLIQQNFNELGIYIFQQNIKLSNELEQKQKQILKDIEDQKTLLGEVKKGVGENVIDDVKSKLLYNDIENKLINKIDGLEHRIKTLYLKNAEMEKRLFNIDKKPKSIVNFEPK